MGNLRLRHQSLAIDTRFYFYEGEKEVKAGVIEFTPDDNPAWCRNAWLRGFNINADTGQPILPGEFDAIFARAESAESAEGTPSEGPRPKR